MHKYKMKDQEEGKSLKLKHVSSPRMFSVIRGIARNITLNIGENLHKNLSHP